MCPGESVYLLDVDAVCKLPDGKVILLFSFIIFAIYCMAGMDLTSMNLDFARYAIHLMVVEGNSEVKQRCETQYSPRYNQHLSLIL